jgi:predicted  nucleic acid-binding Zn-ribbon protein
MELTIMNDTRFVNQYIHMCFHKLSEKYGFDINEAKEILHGLDKEVAIHCVNTLCYSLERLPFKYRNDKDIVLAILNDEDDVYSFRYASEELRNDKEIVSLAVSKNGSALQYASKELRNDKEIVMLAGPQHFEYASDDLKKDREFIIHSDIGLEFVSDELLHDRPFVLTKIKQSGYELNHLPDEFLDDKEIVLIALKDDGYNIDYISDTLKTDREVVLTALYYSRWDVLDYAAEELFEDKSFMLEAIKQDKETYRYISDMLRNDVDIIEAYGI